MDKRYKKGKQQISPPKSITASAEQGKNFENTDDDDVDDTRPDNIVDDDDRRRSDDYEDEGKEETNWDSLFTRGKPSQKDNKGISVRENRKSKSEKPEKAQATGSKKNILPNNKRPNAKGASFEKQQNKGLTAAEVYKRKDSNTNLSSVREEDPDDPAVLPKGVKVIGTTKPWAKRKLDIKSPTNMIAEDSEDESPEKAATQEQQVDSAVNNTMADKSGRYIKTASVKKNPQTPADKSKIPAVTPSPNIPNNTNVRDIQPGSSPPLTMAPSKTTLDSTESSERASPRVSYLFHDAQAAARLTGKPLGPKKPKDGMFSGAKQVLKRLLAPPQPSQLAKETPWLVNERDASRQDKLAKFKFFASSRLRYKARTMIGATGSRHFNQKRRSSLASGTTLPLTLVPNLEHINEGEEERMAQVQRRRVVDNTDLRTMAILQSRLKELKTYPE
ncbi:hypothetical protein PoB_004647600 [Plakobranchus ocellatus]|uniref:Uncharacterized protein n=1 Tax=Plakobranchus ocellatus TaxID=259542 RepID=A0AAV4BHP4_9GAST|nr:hypothetical protein PoB_004647600 [Plakobranchus ocellatus]